jgi:hypothetical protein
VIDPAQTLRLIELTHEHVDDYGVGKLNHSEIAVDWHKFRADAEALLKKYGKAYKIKKALLDATAKPKKPDPRALEKIRITNPDGYRTQIPSPDNPLKYVDHLFGCGEIIEVEHYRALQLIENGKAETVEASM